MLLASALGGLAAACSDEQVDIDAVATLTAVASGTPMAGHADAVEAAIERYHERSLDYRTQMQEYTPGGDYLNYSTFYNVEGSERIRLDERGIPQVQYGSEHHYNPVTAAQYALALHGEYLSGDTPLEDFLAIADFLLEWQETSGALPFPFEYEAYVSGDVYEAGWTSGMAQGQALSVFARAYALTNDEAYLDAGERAVDFLGASKADGGPQTTYVDLDERLDGLLFFREYPNDPDIYTLNGFMFTMLGLLDWTETIPPEASPSVAVARDYFDRAMETLVAVLPLYDVGGFSAYDLGFLVHGVEPNLQPSYHAVHIAQLHVLHSATGVEMLKTFEKRWIGYVEEGDR